MPLIDFVLNGEPVEVEANPDVPLLFVLRNLATPGPKLGCTAEQCGACRILADGEPVYSCTTPVGEMRGRSHRNRIGNRLVRAPGACSCQRDAMRLLPARDRRCRRGAVSPQSPTVPGRDPRRARWSTLPVRFPSTSLAGASRLSDCCGPRRQTSKTHRSRCASNRRAIEVPGCRRRSRPCRRLTVGLPLSQAGLSP